MPSSRRSRVLGTVTTLAPVLAQTAKVVAGDVVDRLRPGGGAEAVPDVVIEEPAGAADYARRVHATGTVAADPADVVALLTDLDRVHEWLTLHRSWRGERPSRMEQGAEFTQQISLMDIPAQARWSVARVDAAGLDEDRVRAWAVVRLVLNAFRAVRAGDPGPAYVTRMLTVVKAVQP